MSIADGDSIAVGEVQVTGVYTPGHTPGGMSWTWQACEADRCVTVVFADSLSSVSADGYRFTDGLGEAIRSSAEKVAALDCDVMVATHPFIYDLHGKFAAGREAFIDSGACATYGQGALRKLQKRLTEESAP